MQMFFFWKIAGKNHSMVIIDQWTVVGLTVVGLTVVGLTAPLNSGCQIFPKGPTFGIISRHPILADQPQKFSKGAIRIANFMGGAHAEKTQFFGQNFPISA